MSVSVFTSVTILCKCCSRPNNAQKVGLFKARVNLLCIQHQSCIKPPGRGGGVLPYMGYIGMCHCEGYGFQAVYSRIGYIIFQETDQLVDDSIS